MIAGKTIAAVVPAYNEELLISKTVNSMPDYVDAIIVVNDGSTDKTLQLLVEMQKTEKRLDIVDHKINKGLGQSLITGYVRAREKEYDVVTIMAGDAQMCPDDLPTIIQPIVENNADYVKGNRLLVGDVAKHMPMHRLIGNAGLTLLTKFATGYWHIIDPQCGYTAISKKALASIPIENMTKGYGYNADILNMLNIRNFIVSDVEVKPVYGQEQSKIKLHSYIPNIIYLITKLFIRRIVHKHFVLNFNPLCLSYFAGLLLIIGCGIPLGMRLFWLYLKTGTFPQTTMLCLMLVSIAGLQTLLSAIQSDMEDNKWNNIKTNMHGALNEINNNTST
ncbi:glycosyltransferase family 2 protein [Verrucomicrobia bacterium]|nr:glycosyltransferase family 2 protein [Verrucomicrobiota bacterium]